MLRFIFIVLLLLSLFLIFNTPHKTYPLETHCIYEQIVGKWILYKGLESSSGETTIQRCSHHHINHFKPEKTVLVDLQEPNIVIDISTKNKGTWTMVDDGGFEININGFSYFAYFNFTKTWWGKVHSHCDKTFTGQYHEESVNPSKWGCFYAEKVKTSSLNSVNLNKYQLQGYPKYSKTSGNLKFHNNLTLISQINNDKTKKWKATYYPQFEGKKLSNIIGKKVANYVIEDKIKHKKKMQQLYYKNLKKQNKKLLTENDFPETFDWRKVKGQSFVGYVRDQLQCGACFSFGLMEGFNSRIRIKTNNTQKMIASPQQIMDCNPNSDSCQGGYPFVVGRYGKEFGFAEEKCWPYEGYENKCHHFGKCKRNFVKNYKYVGGFYGASNEVNMMNEIYNNGPIATSFWVYDDFFNYKEGIYHGSVHKKEGKYYEAADHAVAIVGWSKEKGKHGEKYWIVKNSWNSGWGLDGYFLIRKGKDDCSIESSTVSVDV